MNFNLLLGDVAVGDEVGGVEDKPQEVEEQERKVT